MHTRSLKHFSEVFLGILFMAVVVLGKTQLKMFIVVFDLEHVTRISWLRFISTKIISLLHVLKSIVKYNKNFFQI